MLKWSKTSEDQGQRYSMLGSHQGQIKTNNFLCVVNVFRNMCYTNSMPVTETHSYVQYWQWKLTTQALKFPPSGSWTHSDWFDGLVFCILS